MSELSEDHVSVGYDSALLRRLLHYLRPYRWQAALAGLLRRSGLSRSQAQRRAEDALLTIQGALVLARARNDAGIFRRALSDLTARLLAP